MAAAVGRGCFGCQEPLAEQLDRGIDVVDDAEFGLQVCGPHIHVEQPSRLSTQHQGPQGEQGQRRGTRAWLGGRVNDTVLHTLIRVTLRILDGHVDEMVQGIRVLNEPVREVANGLAIVAGTKPLQQIEAGAL